MNLSSQPNFCRTPLFWLMCVFKCYFPYKFKQKHANFFWQLTLSLHSSLYSQIRRQVIMVKIIVPDCNLIDSLWFITMTEVNYVNLKKQHSEKSFSYRLWKCFLWVNTLLYMFTCWFHSFLGKISSQIPDNKKSNLCISLVTHTFAQYCTFGCFSLHINITSRSWCLK